MHNTMFIDPEGLLEKLHQLLVDHKRVALTGMGGIGKSTLAREYAECYTGDFYKRYIWINAQSSKDLLEEFVAKVGANEQLDAEMLAVTKSIGSARTAQEAVRDRFLTILKERLYDKPKKPYLLIFQGIDKPEPTIRQFYDAEATTYHVLFTSRDERFWEKPAYNVLPFAMSFMREETAVKLLCRETAIDFDTLSRPERKSANALAVSIAGGLPLAIHAIGEAYHESGFDSLSSYLEPFKNDLGRQKHVFGGNEETSGEIVVDTEADEPGHPEVYRTFHTLLTLATDGAKYPSSLVADTKRVLSLLSVMAPAPLPRNLLKMVLSPGSQEPASNAGGSLEVRTEAAVTHVASSGLLRRDRSEGGDTLFMHNMIQKVINFDTEDAGRRQAEEQALRIVNEALAQAEQADSLAALSALFPHAKALYDSGVEAAGCPHLEQFVADLQVQEALESGDWSIVLTGKRGELPSYAAFRNMEKPEWQKKMRRIVASLDKAVPDRTQARQCFTCIYFLAHYWWDGYFGEVQHGTRRLADSLPEAWSACHSEAEEQKFLGALREFRSRYPSVRIYDMRRVQGEDWNAVYRALMGLCNALEADLDKPKPRQREGFTPSERYLYGILSIYMAGALRCADKAPGYRKRDNPKVWKLYGRSQELFHANGDGFHYSWALWEEADARRETAQSLKEHPAFLGGRNAWKGGAEEAEKKALAALEIAARLREPFPPKAAPEAIPETASEAADGPDDPEAAGGELDAELIANSYRVLADLRWTDETRRNGSWGCYCAATLAAYAFLESQADEYAVEFYGEQVSRVMDRLLHQPPHGDNDWISAVLICRFLQSFWGEYWKGHLLPVPDFHPALEAWDRAGLQATLFPRTPTQEEVKEPGSWARRSLACVLEMMPEAAADMQALLRPHRFDEVAAVLRTESRASGVPYTEWVIDKAAKLHLRPIRRDDIAVLADMASSAFGSEKEGALVHDMLHTHCDTVTTIRLDATNHTMLPTRYYVLTRAGTVLGLSGLYRTIWTDKTVFSLGWYFIDPAWVGKGVGRLLLDATMQIARKRGGTRLMVETSVGLTAATRLYEKVGFQSVGEVPDYFGPGVTLKLYTCDLSKIQTEIQGAEDIPDGL